MNVQINVIKLIIKLKINAKNVIEKTDYRNAQSVNIKMEMLYVLNVRINFFLINHKMNVRNVMISQIIVKNVNLIVRHYVQNVKMVITKVKIIKNVQNVKVKLKNVINVKKWMEMLNVLDVRMAFFLINNKLNVISVVKLQKIVINVNITRSLEPNVKNVRIMSISQIKLKINV